jgi:hypothetical protein
MHRFGTIDGVFHLAGASSGGLLQAQRDTQIRAVLAPKVAGTLNLLHALRDPRPGFVLLFSSLVSATGAFGQTSYGAANGFMNGLVDWARGRGLPVTSVAWDAWQVEGSQGRLLQGFEAAASRAAAFRGTQGIRFDEGLQLIERALVTGHAHCLVSPFELAQSVREYRRFNLDSLRESGTADAACANGTALIGASLRETVAQIWTEVLGAAAASPPARRFLELGGHSLLAIQMAARLRAVTGQKVELRWILNNPTLDELTDVLSGAEAEVASSDAIGSLLDEIETLTAEEVQRRLSRLPQSQSRAHFAGTA